MSQRESLSHPEVKQTLKNMKQKFFSSSADLIERQSRLFASKTLLPGSVAELLMHRPTREPDLIKQFSESYDDATPIIKPYDWLKSSWVTLISQYQCLNSSIE